MTEYVNPVTNPDYEDDSVGWTKSGFDIVEDATLAHSGSWYADVRDTYILPDPARIFNHPTTGPLALGIGTVYQLTVWYSSENIDLSRPEVIVDPGDGTYVDTGMVLAPNTGWTLSDTYTFTVVTPGAVRLRMELNLNGQPMNTDAVWRVDDWFLQVAHTPLDTTDKVPDPDSRDPQLFQRGVKDSMRGIILKEFQVTRDLQGRVTGRSDTDQPDREDLVALWGMPAPRRDIEP